MNIFSIQLRMGFDIYYLYNCDEYDSSALGWG